MSAAVEKLGKDLCRCCHAEGSFHYLSEPRYVLGQTEVYSDMMKSCLDIELPPLNGAYCAKTYTICETCILRLRDATNFKHQVLLCEEHFRQMYKNIARANIELKVETQGAYDNDSFGLKHEEHGTCANEVKEEYSMMEDDDGGDDKFDDSDDEQPVIKIKVEGPRKKKMLNRNRASKESKVVSKRERKTYSRTVKDSEVPAVGEKTGEQTSEPKEDCTMMEDDDDGADIKFDDSDDDRPVIKINVESGKKKRMQTRTKEGKVKTGKRKTRTMKDDDDVGDDVEGNEAQEHKRGCPHIEDFILDTQDVIKRYSCKACKVAYRRVSDLRNHITRTHLKKKFIKCRLCPETFMYHTQRKQHMLQHGAKEEKYICGDCKREFKRKNTLAEHMMDVHIEKECLKCVLKFTRKKILFHMNEAHGVPMPTCGVCGLKTLKESALIRHQRNVHLNEKNKRCSICEKRFYTQSNLQDHMITHNQVKTFKCDVCMKSFARKECYKTHYRIHSGDRPFQCRFCSASFIQRASLRFHMKSHHPGT